MYEEGVGVRGSRRTRGSVGRERVETRGSRGKKSGGKNEQGLCPIANFPYCR